MILKFLRKTALFLLFVLLTPFGLILSFMPGFNGPKEWFEFTWDELSK
jgi:hypothetical protein